MKQLTLSTLMLTVGLFALQGCSILSPTENNTAAMLIPDANPLMNHYIAWVPRDKAQTANVAEAMAHISLVNARQQTAKQLCGGEWLVHGESVESVGPLPARAPASAGGYPAWYYRVSHWSGVQGCNHTDRKQLYSVLQNHLPAWMSLSPADMTTISLLH